MTATMALRGPDAEGVWLDEHVALGHRRLAVIDVEGGVQPMALDGRAVMVYSGEAYNFRELTAELKGLGHTFRTRSDTEVVLRAYLQWGADFVDHLNGMYALAIWDVAARELLLVRDRMGIKPLYYAPTRDGVLFGSEPKAILANPGFTARIDDEGLAELIANIKTPGHAVFSGMYEVRPGHVVRVTRQGHTERRYWGLSATEHTEGTEETVAHVRELLEDIVRRQLISDVPLCTLLSGGLDSSALTAFAQHELGAEGPVRSFSVDFVDESGGFVPDEMRGTPDAPFAADVVKHVGTLHKDVVLDSGQLAEPSAVEAVIKARDLPGMGEMDTSLYLLFAEIRRHSTVALSGESADEVFGGYQWFHDPEAVASESFPWLRTVLGDGSRDALLDPGFRRRIDVASYLADRYRQALAEVPHLPDADPHERRMREICYLHLTRFVQNLLDRKDRMSMAVGLEVRVPFCDHRLVDYVFNTPWALKTFDGREKSLLRGAAAGLLPDSVVQRVKSPYPSTQNPSYERAVRDRVTEILADRDSPILPIADLQAVGEALRRPVGRASLQRDRFPMERFIMLNDWLARYRPVFDTASV
jgi:asparagine synthase (glutamine-hydrolysing)